ncbi:MAG: DUF1415 family protein [Pseudomonadota bacterium]
MKQQAITDVECWLRDCVLDLSLCPFARVPWQAGRVQLVVMAANESLITGVEREIQQLTTDAADTETTLLILPGRLQRFLDFNDCVGDLEDWLTASQLDQLFQLVGFHPQYLFAGEATDDASHFTNRAPYPIVQILRAASVAKAAEESDTLAIPQRNIDTLRSLSKEQLRALFPWSYRS